MSTAPTTTRDRLHLAGIIAVFALYIALLGYLWSPWLPPGDAVTYVEQARAGTLGVRTVHLGYLAQLVVLVPLIGDAAAPLLAAVWGLAALMAALMAARVLLGARIVALVAPLVLMSAAGLWTHSLFPEVYGPAAAALLGAAALAYRGHRWPAAGLAALAALMHPGSLAWLPTVALLLRPRPGHRVWIDRLVFAAGVAAPVVTVALIFHSDYLSGDRGVAAVISWPRPWPALQRCYRLAAGTAPLLGSLAALGLLDPAGRRWSRALVGGLCLSLLTDWRDDVPSAWPALVLISPVAAVGAAWLYGATHHRAAVTMALLLLIAAGIGEATSRHDRERRVLQRQFEAIRSLSGPDAPRAEGSHGYTTWYEYYVGPAGSTDVVLLPPGQPWPAGRCRAAEVRDAAGSTVHVCPGLDVFAAP